MTIHLASASTALSKYWQAYRASWGRDRSIPFHALAKVPDHIALQRRTDHDFLLVVGGQGKGFDAAVAVPVFGDEQPLQMDFFIHV